MIIIMLGAPATGKGTVAGVLSEKLGIPRVSTGDIFRQNIKEKTKLGKSIKKILAKGELVPDELTIDTVRNRLRQADVENGIILDGFPRTLKQGEALNNMLEDENKRINMVLNLVTPKEELIERIVNRRVCSNQDCKAVYNLILNPPKEDGICDKCGSKLMQRKDDNVKTANNRFENYMEETSPLIEFYDNLGVLYNATVSKEINKMGENVAEEVVEYIKENNGNIPSGENRKKEF